jgi:hypothetical protein
MTSAMDHVRDILGWSRWWSTATPTPASCALRGPRQVGADRLVNAVAAVTSTGPLHRGRLRPPPPRRDRPGRQVPWRHHARGRDIGRRPVPAGGAPGEGELVAPENAIGRNTVESIQSGIINSMPAGRQASGAVQGGAGGDCRVSPQAVPPRWSSANATMGFWTLFNLEVSS